MKKRGKLSIITGGSKIRSPPTSPLLPLLETSLNLCDVEVSSSDEEDNSPWDERWVVDENEEEEKRLWAEKHKQKIAKSPKVEPRNQSTNKQRRSKSDDDAIPGSSNNKHERPKSKQRRASAEEDVPCYRISSDEMTNSEEIKTSEEEDTASERSSGPGQYHLLAASSLFLQPRSLSADDNLFALSRGRSLSLTEEVMRGYWNQNSPHPVTIQVSEEADKSPDLSTARQYHSSDSLRDDDSEEEKNKETEKGKEKGSDGENGSMAIGGKLYEDKRTEHLVKRSRSFSVENNASVYSPLAPRRRRALTPQRTPRPYMIKTPITISGEQPPSGGPSGEEECLEWKPLWKAN